MKLYYASIGIILVLAVIVYFMKFNVYNINNKNIKYTQEEVLVSEENNTLFLNDRSYFPNLSKVKLVTLKDPYSAKLFEEFLNDTLLVLHISNKNCHDCILAAIEQLKLANKFGSKISSNFVIIADFFSIRELKLFIKMHSIEFEVYLVVDGSLNFISDSIAKPNLFIYLPDYKIYSKFIPNKSVPDKMEKYLEFVSRKYFKHSRF